jgi:leucyl aminopeptidase
VLVGLGNKTDRWTLAGLALTLPEGVYMLDGRPDREPATMAALAWAIGSYQFDRYKQPKRSPARLCWPQNADRAAVIRGFEAVCLVRDLINTPAADLGPAELAAAAESLAKEFGASCRTIVGDALLRENYPLIHAVGRASAREPRLIDLVWGDPSAPRLTLVGKGVCFDTGGLNLKQGSKMLYMKLDMGGGAHALALARMVMAARLPVRLRVLVPAVENAIGSNATRPLDVVRSRKGLTVEIADTDAEGRLILADALAEASREQPDLIVDFATLTGSARVALGPDVTAMFANDDSIAAQLEQCAAKTEDWLWRLPLWQPYAANLEGKVGDLTNVADLNLGPTTMAGAIHAALFLERFIDPGVKWIHLDIFGWNMKGRPGRPEGGEAANLFAVYRLLEQRYSVGR